MERPQAAQIQIWLQMQKNSAGHLRLAELQFGEYPGSVSFRSMSYEKLY